MPHARDARQIEVVAPHPCRGAVCGPQGAEARASNCLTTLPGKQNNNNNYDPKPFLLLFE